MRHHYIRTPLSALFGVIALVMISSSILAVWANQTLTDTKTFTAAVAPLVKQPAIQEFIAQSVTDQLMSSAPASELASVLLPPAEAEGKTYDQLVAAITPVIHDSVTQVVGSPAFVELWRSTSETAHAGLIRQLQTNSPELTLDLGPFINGVAQEVKKTKLGPIGDKFQLEPGMAKLDLAGTPVAQVHKYYGFLRTATLGVVLITLLSIVLCVAISVHHAKTMRRVLVNAGIMALGLAGGIWALQLVHFNSPDAARQRAVIVFAQTLLHNLQVACVVLGVVCIVAAIVSKFVPNWRPVRS